MTVTKEEVAERLVDAAALMSTVPHYKSPGPAGECVATALGGHIESIRAIKRALGVFSVDGVYEWNDRPERTKDECMELLVTTADKVRNGDLILEGVSY